MTLGLRQFWRAASWLPRGLLVAVLASLAIHIGTYFGLAPTGPFEALWMMHLVLFTLAAITFGTVAHHHQVAWHMRWTSPPPIGIRARLVLLALSLYAYMVLLLAFSPGESATAAIAIRDGVPVRIQDGVEEPSTWREYEDYSRNDLRVFSAVWVTLGFTFALGAHAATTRLRWYAGQVRPAA